MLWSCFVHKALHAHFVEPSRAHASQSLPGRTAVHLMCRQVADVLPLQVLPHLEVGARGVQQVGDGLQQWSGWGIGSPQESLAVHAARR